MQDGLNLPIYGQRSECVHVICEDEIAGGDRKGPPISYTNVRFGDVFTLTFDREKGMMHVKLLSGAYTKFMCDDANAHLMLREYENYTNRRFGKHLFNPVLEEEAREQLAKRDARLTQRANKKAKTSKKK